MGARRLDGQDPSAQETGQKTEPEQKNPPSPNPKKSPPPGTEKVGESLKFSESPAFHEAPITEGGSGGYSSSMSAPMAVPQGGTGVEEKALEGLLLETPRWRVGPHGLVERGEAGGEWQAAASGVEADLNAVSFANRWVGWIIGEKGTILRSEDGGQTWHKISFPNRSDLLTVSAEDWQSARVTTQSGTTYVTRDGGATWSRASAPEARGSGRQGAGQP